jgi:hypothetical protein
MEEKYFFANYSLHSIILVVLVLQIYTKPQQKIMKRKKSISIQLKLKEVFLVRTACRDPIISFWASLPPTLRGLLEGVGGC